MDRSLRLAALLACAALSACATERTPTTGQGVGGAVQQPLRDLSVIREVAPEPLKAAVTAPYSTDALADCVAIAIELEKLNAALGPDVDTLGQKQGQAEGLAADMIRGTLSLPFRGVVRTLTGAQQREAQMRAAVTAGMVRRGFVKGRASAMGCAPVIQIKAAQP
jgi:hypothetical protein